MSNTVHLVFQILAGVGGAALAALGVYTGNSAQTVMGCSLLLGALAGSHLGQWVDKNAQAIQSDVSKAEALLPALLPFLSPQAQAIVKAADADLDAVIAALVQAAAQQNQAAGAAAAAKPGSPSQG